MPSTVPSSVLQTPAQGLNLSSGTLADQIAGKPALLVFLRHFGCPFCKETVSDLKKISLQNPLFPPIVFFAQGNLQECQDFFANFWPTARVFSDPERNAYKAMGLRRGSFGEIMGLRVWTCTVRAMFKGHFIGKPVGDPWLMPGAFLILGDQILWSYPYTHQGDRPDWSKLPDPASAATVATVS